LYKSNAKGVVWNHRDALKLLKKAWTVEPFNINTILTYGEGFLAHSRDDRTRQSPSEPPNGLTKCIEFLLERVESIIKQMSIGNVKKGHARQLVGRIGMWIERKGPDLATRHLSREDSDGRVVKEWQIGQQSISSFQSAVGKIREIYNQFPI